MTDQPKNVKDKLLADIEREWGALNASLDKLDETQMTEIRDPQGWSVKDHMIHMSFWERGVCFYLQGKPRHLGMWIDAELLQHGTFDEINAVIQQAQKDMS
ncbi:MAG: DinB family protein, partial [Anaerolineales bacterium]